MFVIGFIEGYFILCDYNNLVCYIFCVMWINFDYVFCCLGNDCIISCFLVLDFIVFFCVYVSLIWSCCKSFIG